MIWGRKMMGINNIAVADIFARYFKEKVLSLTKDQKSLIYHYCPPLAFPKIIERKELWLTPISMLNDSAEGTWVYVVFEKRFINKFSKFQQEHPEISNAFNVFCNILGKMKENIYGSIPYNFVCCFSEASDSLNQFRLYADDTKGYALGFNIVKYQHKARRVKNSKSIEKLYLSPVIYDEEFQNEIVDKIIDEAIKVYLLNQNPNDFYNTLLPLVDLACILKNPSFHEEKEWRLVCIITDENVDTILQDDFHGKLIFRYNYEEQNLHLEEVQLGSNNINSPKHIERYLTKKGLSLYIKKSESTYVGRL